MRASGSVRRLRAHNIFPCRNNANPEFKQTFLITRPKKGENPQVKINIVDADATDLSKIQDDDSIGSAVFNIRGALCCLPAVLPCTAND